VGAFGNLEAVQTSGLRLAGAKFFTTTATDRSIYGKKGVRKVSQVMLERALTAFSAERRLRNSADDAGDIGRRVRCADAGARSGQGRGRTGGLSDQRELLERRCMVSKVTKRIVYLNIAVNIV
jgi:hypothetical protein